MSHLLLFSVLATLAGATSYQQIAAFIALQRERLNAVFGACFRRAPAVNTLRHLFLALGRDDLEAAFRHHARDLNARPAPEALRTVALDGKTLRGSVEPSGSPDFDHLTDRKAVHVLSAFASDAALILAHQELAGAPDEVTAVPKLMAELGLTGVLFTADALHCQRDGFAQAAAAGNALLVRVKDNQPTLHATLAGLCATGCPFDSHETVDRRHGRQDHRRVEVFDTAGQLDEPWQPLVSCVARVSRLTYIKDTRSGLWATREEVGYYPGQTRHSAKVLGCAIRAHWGIENRAHYVRDVTLGEDASRIRTKPGMMARIRSVALNVLRANGVQNISLALYANGTVARLGVRRPIGYFRVCSLAEGGCVAWMLRLVKIGIEGEGPCADIMEIRRPDNLVDIANLGLTLAEAKPLLAGVQREIVAAQAKTHAVRRPECPRCDGVCRVKDYQDHAVSTLFGPVTLRLPRFRCAVCGGIEAGLAWPLHCRSTPELDRLQAHLSALMTYRTAADVLAQMFSVDARTHHETLRRHTLKVGEALGDYVATRPEAAASAIMVTLDSTFIRSCAEGERHLEARVGNVETASGGRQVFGAVAKADTDIRALIRRNLDAVGRTGDTALTAFTDGCPGLRGLLADAGVTTPPMLDWFHVAMRLQHLNQIADGLSADDPARGAAKAVIVEEVERLHWRIWNGKARDAQVSIDRIRAVMHHFRGAPDQRRSAAPSRKLWTALRTLDSYLTSQSAWLVNYAERHRAGLRVGTAITEGTANFLVNRRMNKSQQMRWSRRGADLLLQVRCAVYNGTLGSGFGQRFQPANDPCPPMAIAA